MILNRDFGLVGDYSCGLTLTGRILPESESEQDSLFLVIKHLKWCYP